MSAPPVHRRALEPVLPAAACPAPPAEPDPEAAVDALARTLWGEARGEPLAGIEAVASVVVNRVAEARAGGRRWWGTDVVSVCRAPRQFSCWDEGDPNRPKLLAATAADPAFATCLRVARRAVAGLLADRTLGATHYHAEGAFPRWARGKLPSAAIGRHLFYSDVE
jgi:spore germination cell wall hydrolase CwlJ-like protein